MLSLSLSPCQVSVVLVGACCLRYRIVSEMQYRKSSWHNRLLHLKAHRMPRHCTEVCNTHSKDFTTLAATILFFIANSGNTRLTLQCNLTGQCGVLPDSKAEPSWFFLPDDPVFCFVFCLFTDRQAPLKWMRPCFFTQGYCGSEHGLSVWHVLSCLQYEVDRRDQRMTSSSQPGASFRTGRLLVPLSLSVLHAGKPIDSLLSQKNTECTDGGATV